ncbi:MAG: hypothetical protein H8E53_10940 [Planctomycetes bacterium]|nr:hypothetical protein [Planctomycetota bacterium]
MSGAPIKDGKMKGQFTLHITPDLWVPRDHKHYTMEFDIDAAVDNAGKMSGKYEIAKINTKDVSVKDLGRSGKVTGQVSDDNQPNLPDNVTFQCNMQGTLVGGDPTYGGRCMVLLLGLEGGKLTSTIHGQLSQKFAVHGKKGFTFKGNTATADRDRIKAHITVPSMTLDMEPCRYIYELQGAYLGPVMVGMYKLTVKIEGKSAVVLTGSFDGKWTKGVTHMKKSDDRPWFKPVTGFKPPAAGEHPRLLFRKSDLPALRAKAKTPEGKAILKRLGVLLDGKEGKTMTTLFSKATHAYMGGGYKSTSIDTPGVYTLSHVAGYGLLYQLTGEQKYADFGKQCFEKALAGVRDRDDRYSFLKPGGALRAGPTVGWYAVGYDLCYDGWDKATREKFGLALAEYSEGSKKTYDLEALARGTMPPGSNHFGMQIGGASMALLAVTGEKFVDQKKIDTLLAIARQSMIRNVSEGFGDGGFFAEGDGTGSMASHIAYLTAVQAWRNAGGLDYASIDRPNVRMTALKWVYLTVFRNGKPDVWPIRGAYGHNVWSRRGISGGGYFALGLGAVSQPQQAAMKWCYNHFLAGPDAQASAPYDTISRYPHVAVCSLVNWPISQAPKPPATVLPLCYRDSSCGFYAWRNRWRDANDTVITVLTNRTQGYMSAKPDRTLCLNTMGKHIRWGSVQDGPTKYWRSSPGGQASSLTLADGTCFVVDFTGASGADVMLVTTGKAEGQSVKLGGKTLTFYFPTVQSPPKAKIQGDAIVIGKQQIMLKGGNLAVSVSME